MIYWSRSAWRWGRRFLALYGKRRRHSFYGLFCLLYLSFFLELWLLLWKIICLKLRFHLLNFWRRRWGPYFFNRWRRRYMLLSRRNVIRLRNMSVNRWWWRRRSFLFYWHLRLRLLELLNFRLLLVLNWWRGRIILLLRLLRNHWRWGLFLNLWRCRRRLLLSWWFSHRSGLLFNILLMMLSRRRWWLWIFLCRNLNRWRFVNNCLSLLLRLLYWLCYCFFYSYRWRRWVI